MGASVVGQLVVKLTAHTAEYESKLQKAGLAAKSFSNNMSFIQGVGGNSAVMLSGVGGAALGAAKAVFELGKAFAQMALAQARAMEDTMRMANRMDMASEQLVALREAAEDYGVEDMIGPALSRMNAKVGKAAIGDDGAQKAFANLGLDPTALARMDTSDKYKAIADAIRDLGNASLQAAAAQSIFGKSGMTMVGMLQGGSEAVERASAEARALGIAFSDGDAAVAKLATGGMRDAYDAVDGLKNKFAIELAPAIAELTDSFIVMVGAIKPAFDWMMETWGAGISTVYHTIQSAFARVSEAIMEIIRVAHYALADFFEFAGNLPSALGGDWFLEQAEAARQFADTLAELRREHYEASLHASPAEKVSAARTKAADAAKLRAELRMAPMPDLNSSLTSSSARWDIAKAVVQGTREFANMIADMGQKKPEINEMKKQTRLQEQIRDRLDFMEGEF